MANPFLVANGKKKIINCARIVEGKNREKIVRYHHMENVTSL